MLCAGIWFNSVYWPFNREDTLGIYAYFGRYMAENRTLAELPGALTVYEAYPIMIPLTYSYAYLASGWHNDSLAASFPALLSIGCLVAIFTLGTLMRGHLAGWLAAALLALAPTFSSWASSGYVDLPMAYFYTLAAIFAWRLWQTGRWSDALLLGGSLGCAAWTKNAALVGVLLAGVWLLWAWRKPRIGWRPIVLAAVACALIAAPWYIRNWLGASLILPPTVWTDQAQQTLETLFVLVTRPQNYSLTGVIVTLSMLSALAQLITGRLKAQTQMILLWTIPFYAIWWRFASYDPRFILLFLPLLCVLAGINLANLWESLPAGFRQRLRLPTMVVAVLLAVTMLWNSVEFKDDLLRNPFMSFEERRATALSERQPALYERLYGD
jgi:4-amino-4-deoxy-L-arabinose transferase-like glycosyltransferase